MKKTVAYLVLSVVIAGLLSAFTELNVRDDVLNTIYTVAGVIFSVGMSIAITPKTEKVTNDNIRATIRASYLAVRNSFMYLFGMGTVLYIVAQAFEITKHPASLDFLCAVFILLSVVFYVFNFVKLQKLGIEVEDQILKEEKSKNNKLVEESKNM